MTKIKTTTKTNSLHRSIWSASYLILLIKCLAVNRTWAVPNQTNIRYKTLFYVSLTALDTFILSYNLFNMLKQKSNFIFFVVLKPASYLIQFYNKKLDKSWHAFNLKANFNWKSMHIIIIPLNRHLFKFLLKIISATLKKSFNHSVQIIIKYFKYK